ncbi:hypothetical protein E4U14_005952 [Claviceps sp. LM454 group G7]|nr:hypothetical protein E4U14_005952 [Claviceps sp. LM454 group G7]
MLGSNSVLRVSGREDGVARPVPVKAHSSPRRYIHTSPTLRSKDHPTPFGESCLPDARALKLHNNMEFKRTRHRAYTYGLMGPREEKSRARVFPPWNAQDQEDIAV